MSNTPIRIFLSNQKEQIHQLKSPVPIRVENSLSFLENNKKSNNYYTPQKISNSASNAITEMNLSTQEQSEIKCVNILEEDDIEVLVRVRNCACNPQDQDDKFSIQNKFNKEKSVFRNLNNDWQRITECLK